MNYKYNVSSRGSIYTTYNPSRPQEVVGTYGVADEEGVLDKLDRAHEAQMQWRNVPGAVRAEKVLGFIEAVESNVDRISEAITREQGKILIESRNEILKGCSEGRFICGEALRIGARSIGSARTKVRNLILRRPRGVIFAISPWNFPAMTPLRKMCPALTFGNAIVLKPSQFTPAAAFIIEEIARPFFPDGLVQVVMCSGSTASKIIGNQKVDGLSFTGSVDTGRKVYSAAANNLIPVQLELGGKNAVIINDTSDLDSCLDQVSAAAFQTGGQRCTGISRVIVARNLAKKVIDGLAKRAESIKLGDGMDSSSQMGPLCHHGHWETVCDMTRRAIAEGTVPITGGKPAEGAGVKGGFFYEPTILENVESRSIAGNDEIFGPVLSVISYDDFDESIKILNDTPYGLTSSFFSDSHSLVQRFLDESLHGMLHVNNGTIPDMNMPFGGMKSSGVGAYSVGSSSADFYTIEQSAYLAW